VLDGVCVVVVALPPQPQLQPPVLLFAFVPPPQPHEDVPPQLQFVVQVDPLAPLRGVTPRDIVSV
jgi:hypothetical protein